MTDLVTRQLADYIARTTYDDLPVDVVQKARLCVLDSLGCMIGGSQVDEVRIGVDLVLDWGDRSEASIPGMNGSYPAPLASYASAQFANALDYDDTVSGVGHPGASIISTAFTLGQALKSTGPELIVATVAGYDAAVRIGRGMKPSYERAKIVRGHTWAIYGSVAAAASLLKLTPDQTRFALGFAAQHALVPFVGKWYERPITSIKNNYGWAAMGGIMAALLASRGARGNRDVLDGSRGFWAMASSDQWDSDAVVDKLGESHAILDVEFKPFAACRYTHSTLDAVSELMANHEFEIESLNRVVVRAAERVHVFADYEPKTLLDQQFSLPYAIANRLLRRPLTSFGNGDFEVESVARKVEIQTDHDAERQASFAGLPATVEIHLSNGSRLTARVDVPPGTPSRALTIDELCEKFDELVGPVCGGQRANELRELLLGPTDSVTAMGLAAKFGPSEL